MYKRKTTNANATYENANEPQSQRNDDEGACRNVEGLRKGSDDGIVQDLRFLSGGSDPEIGFGESAAQ